MPATLLLALALTGAGTLRPALAQDGMKLQAPASPAGSERIKDVPAIEAAGVTSLKPGTILFTDHRDDPTKPENGLVPYLDWGKLRPGERAALAPHPGYVEPDSCRPSTASPSAGTRP